MIAKLKNSDTKQMVTLSANGLTYLRYKDLTGVCLGQALSELSNALLGSVNAVGDIGEFRKDVENYENLPKEKQKELDAKINSLTPYVGDMASVTDKLILIVAAMISSAESEIRHIDDIVQDIDLNWFADESTEFKKILELVNALSPKKITQKKTKVATK